MTQFYKWLLENGGTRSLRELGERIGDDDVEFLEKCADAAGLERINGAHVVTADNLGPLLREIDSWSPPMPPSEAYTEPVQP